MSEYNRREKAIEYIREARDVHVRWKNFLEAIPETTEELVKALNDPLRRDEIVKRVGNARHHAKWTRRYELVLEELEGG